jgi:hypothetical protein
MGCNIECLQADAMFQIPEKRWGEEKITYEISL